MTVLVVMIVTAGQSAWAGKPKPEPDYTKGENPVLDSYVKWALGPIGAFANIYHSNPHQLLIESIQKGTPADGKLQRGDVILGVKSPSVMPSEYQTFGQLANPYGAPVTVDAKCSRCGSTDQTGRCGHFMWEARMALSAAITEAEKRTGSWC